MLAASNAGAKIFRNNTGTGWVGQRLQHNSERLVLKDPRPLNAGLCEGSSDLIGWIPVTVTPDMVGQKLAVFVALEVKTATGKVSEKQQKFIDAVTADGGVSGIVREPEHVTTLTKSLTKPK